MNSGGQLWMVVTAAVKRQRPSFSSFRSRSSTTTAPLTLIEAVRRLESQELSCESLLNACYERAIEGQKRWNAYTYLCPYEDLLSQAKASDQRRRAKGAVGSSSCPLDGIPVSIKSNIAVCGLPLTAASQMLTNTVSQYDSTHRDATTNISPYDAHVTIKLLREAGAILIGLTNMDEFGMGSWGISSPVYGPTYNPQSNDVLLSAGGSSCGAAASVASGSCLLAIGTDTGGSVRLPASWCGISGFKPTYGLISRHGIISYASSLDTVGFIAPTPQCCALALPYLVNNTTKTTAISPDDRISCGDSTATFYISNNKRNLSHNKPQDDQHSPPLRGIKVGVPAAFSVDPCPPYIKTLWNKAAKILAEKGGAEIIIVPTTVVSPETIKASLSSYYVLACAEASSNLARYDGLRYGTNFEQLLSAPKYGNPSSRSNYETNEREAESEDDNYDDDLSVAVHRQYSATRALGFGPEVVRRILAGTAVLSSDRFHTHYEAAAKQRVILRREFKSAFSKSPKTNATYVTEESGFSGVDVMIVPTSLALPQVLDGNNKKQGSAEEYEKSSTDMLSSDIMTVPLSLAGLPTMSVPVKLMLLDDNELKGNAQMMNMNKVTKGLKVYHKIKSLGIQIFGPPMSEDLVMKVSSFLYENDKEQI